MRVEKVLIGLIFIISSSSCKVDKSSILNKTSPVNFEKFEVLIFQTDDCLNKADIENYSVAKIWLNDSMFIMEQPLYKERYDTFIFKSNNSFIRKKMGQEVIIYKPPVMGDSILSWNKGVSTPVQLLDSIIIDEGEKAYILRHFGTSDLEHSYGHPLEIEYLFTPNEGIIGYNDDGPWGKRVIRIVKKIIYIRGTEVATKYYNFEIPEIWRSDPYRQDPRLIEMEKRENGK